MNIQKKDKGSSRIPTMLIDSGILARMSERHIKVYLVMRRLADPKTSQAWWATATRISLRTGINKSVVTRTIRELSLMGLIEKVKTNQDHGFGPIYKITKVKDINPQKVLDSLPKSRSKHIPILPITELRRIQLKDFKLPKIKI